MRLEQVSVYSISIKQRDLVSSCQQPPHFYLRGRQSRLHLARILSFTFRPSRVTVIVFLTDTNRPTTHIGALNRNRPVAAFTDVAYDQRAIFDVQIIPVHQSS